MKGQKENIQDKRGKLESSNTHPISPKRDHSKGVGVVFILLAQA